MGNDILLFQELEPICLGCDVGIEIVGPQEFVQAGEGRFHEILDGLLCVCLHSIRCFALLALQLNAKTRIRIVISHVEARFARSLENPLFSMERVGLHPPVPRQPRTVTDLEMSAASFLHQLSGLAERVAELTQLVQTRDNEIRDLQSRVDRLETEVTMTYITAPNAKRQAFEPCTCPIECFHHRGEVTGAREFTDHRWDP